MTIKELKAKLVSWDENREISILSNGGEFDLVFIGNAQSTDSVCFILRRKTGSQPVGQKK